MTLTYTRAGFAALCLIDAANCVRLGHADWIIPALLAFAMALVMRPQ